MGGKLVIGLMSGTSLDGIDAALVKISEAEPSSTGLRVDLIEFISSPYDEAARKDILICCNQKEGTVDRICQMNFELAHWFAESVIKVARKAGVDLDRIDLIGSHGQTIYHYVPEIGKTSTLQIGTGAVLAEKTGITTVSNFRVRDVAAGGQGAPLVPYVDYLLYTSSETNRVLQNIGGIGNYTYLPCGGDISEVLGSDTGPGNMLIDAVITILSDGCFSYDQNGSWASKGQVSEELLARLMNHPFIKKNAPKTTGREEFGFDYAYKVISWGKELNLDDKGIVATVTAFTAYSIIDSYRRFIPGKIHQVIIGGGGSYNPILLKMISEYGKKHLENIQFLTQEDIGFSSEAKEAIAFAVLAYQTMKGRANNIPKVTGASKPVVLGDITPGKNFFRYLRW